MHFITLWLNNYLEIWKNSGILTSLQAFWNMLSICHRVVNIRCWQQLRFWKGHTFSTTTFSTMFEVTTVCRSRSWWRTLHPSSMPTHTSFLRFMSLWHSLRCLRFTTYWELNERLSQKLIMVSDYLPNLSAYSHAHRCIYAASLRTVCQTGDFRSAQCLRCSLWLLPF